MFNLGIINKNKYKLALILLVCVGLSIYWPSLYGEYVWDDTLIFISKASLINNPLSFELLMQPVLPGVNYFRPLVMLTWYTEFFFFGQNPLVSHAINIVIYLLNCILVFGVSLRLGRAGNNTNILISFVAALLYAVHPALVETTAWVSGRFDQMVTFGSLLGCYCYLSEKQFNWLKSLKLSVCLLIALGSKELGVVLPFIMISLGIGQMTDPYPIIKNDRNNGLINSIKLIGLRIRELLITQWRWWVICAVIILIYSVTHVIYSGPPEAINYFLYYQYYLSNSIPFHTLWQYFQAVFLPFHTVSNLHPELEIDYQNLIIRIEAMMGLLLFIAIIFYAIIKRNIFSMLLLSSLIGIILVLRFIPLGIVGNTMHERFMTLPLAFVCMAVARVPIIRAADYLSIRAEFLKSFIGLILVVWVSLAIVTSSTIAKFWKSDLTLWNWAFHMYPNSVLARYNYLSGALAEGRPDLALTVLNEYKKKKGGLEVADQLIYANILMRKGDKESMKYYEGALYAIPKFHEMHDGKSKFNRFWLTAMQMAGAYMDYATTKIVFEGDLDSALHYNTIARWYLSEDEAVPVNYQLATIYYLQGNFKEGARILETVEAKKFRDAQIFRRGMGQMVSKYCSLKVHNISSCTFIKENNIFPNLDYTISGG